MSTPSPRDPLRIWGWSADKGGCQAYRIRFPFDAMKAHRPDIVYGFGSVMPEVARETADVVVGQRVCNDGPSKLWQRWAKEGHKRLVYELDDDLWNVDPANEKAYYFFGNPKIRANMKANIQAAHAVTVSTPELAEEVFRQTGHRDIHVVPNAVPAWLLDHEAERNHHVGWGGSPTHHGDFGLLRHGMNKFLQHNRDKTFHCIGMDYASWMKLPPAQCHYTKWVPTPEDFFRTIDYAVGVAPLADNHFNRSKSDIKFLELAALGIPTIASDVAPYRSIKDGDTGFLVRNEHQWSRLLKASVDDPDLFARVGAAGKEYVRNNRTTAHTASAWLTALVS